MYLLKGTAGQTGSFCIFYNIPLHFFQLVFSFLFFFYNLFMPSTILIPLAEPSTWYASINVLKYAFTVIFPLFSIYFINFSDFNSLTLYLFFYTMKHKTLGFCNILYKMFPWYISWYKTTFFQFTEEYYFSTIRKWSIWK